MRPVLTFILFLTLCSVCQSSPDHILVSVKRNYKIPATEKVTLVFEWSDLIKALPSLHVSNVKLTDQHFGNEVPFRVIDTNNDNRPDAITADYTLASNEPVYTFKVRSDGKGAALTTGNVRPDVRFALSYLVPFAERSDKNSTSTTAEKIVQSTLEQYPDPMDLSIISPGKWTYEYGFFLNATYALYLQTKEEKYFNYMKQWVDNFITPDGEWKAGVYNMEEYRLDDILPGRLCILLYQKTGDKKYKKVVDQFITHLTKQPRTSEGGYWHKEIYPNQMWLDGIYMGDVFSMQYAAAFNETKWFDESVVQITLIYKHAYDPATGLLFHGWDESKNKVWADQAKGTSPELWGRAIGWYAMALIDCMDYLPKDHADRKSIEIIFQNLCASILNFQDKKSGLWFQIINKASLSDNWIETSSSAMFVYAFAKGFNKGLLQKRFNDAAMVGYISILENNVYADAGGFIHLDQAVKVGSLNMKNSKGDYAYYISCERRLDDYKGLAALLYASIELKK